jgi:hypothetical protein
MRRAGGARSLGCCGPPGRLYKPTTPEVTAISSLAPAPDPASLAPIPPYEFHVRADVRQFAGDIWAGL